MCESVLDWVVLFQIYAVDLKTGLNKTSRTSLSGTNQCILPHVCPYFEQYKNYHSSIVFCPFRG